MRYIPGRGFLKSYNAGPRPFFDKKAVAHTQPHSNLLSTPETGQYQSKLRKHISKREDLSLRKAQPHARRVWESLLHQKNTTGLATDIVIHKTKPRPDERRGTVSRIGNPLCNPEEHSFRSSTKIPPKQGISRENPRNRSDFEHKPDEVLFGISYDRLRTPSTFVGAPKMRSHIEFLTTPTADTPGTALSLQFDDRRYLIGNMHEGTQRACIQRGQRLSKVSSIFLTGKTEWKNNGGLIGMILTLADASAQAAISAAEKLNEKSIRKSGSQLETKEEDIGAKSRKAIALTQLAQPTLTIHGGPNITHTLATARHFVFRQGMPIKVDEYLEGDPKTRADENWEPTWADSRIQVWAMAISPSLKERVAARSGPKSPKKRPFDEFVSQGTPTPGEAIDVKESYQTWPIAQGKQDQMLRNSIVAQMFNSAWRFDKLVETPLREVQTPAALFIRNEELNKLERYTGPVPDGITPLPDINVMVRRPWPGALVENLPVTRPSSTSMSYIIRNLKQRGTFLPAKARELRVEQGPLWSQLVSGHNVQSMDGVTIEPGMVLEEGREGAGVAVIDLPTADYVDSLVDRPEWKIDKIMTGVGAIIWLLGPGVGQNMTLRDFIHEHSGLKHVFSSQDYCYNYLSMDSSATAAVRLNQIDPSHHAVPVHDNTNLPQTVQPDIQVGPPVDYIQAQRGLSIHTGPMFQIMGTNGVPTLDTGAVLKETPEDVLKLAQAAREQIASELMANGAAEQSLPCRDAEIVCLGTGSALPSKYRNVSATLLRVPGYGSYLLDCGENTLGQLKRVFQPPELAEVLRDLKLIWISHLHADHHLGTASVIKAWYEEVHGKQDNTNRPRRHSSLQQQLLNPIHEIRQEKKLFVASQASMLKWLREYSQVEHFGFDEIVSLECVSVEKSNPSYSKIVSNGSAVGFNPFNPEM